MGTEQPLREVLEQWLGRRSGWSGPDEWTGEDGYNAAMDEVRVILDGLQWGPGAPVAARERPSALEAFTHDGCDTCQIEPGRYARLTRAAGPGVRLGTACSRAGRRGKGTEPDHEHQWSDGPKQEDDWRCVICKVPYPSTPDTTEATLAHIAWAQNVRSEHEATHGEAEQCGAECIAVGLAEFDYTDTTEATLRAALDNIERVINYSWVEFNGKAHVLVWLREARAALQQPAVQPEGGPE